MNLMRPIFFNQNVCGLFSLTFDVSQNILQFNAFINKSSKHLKRAFLDCIMKFGASLGT